MNRTVTRPADAITCTNINAYMNIHHTYFYKLQYCYNFCSFIKCISCDASMTDWWSSVYLKMIFNCIRYMVLNHSMNVNNELERTQKWSWSAPEHYPNTQQFLEQGRDDENYRELQNHNNKLIPVSTKSFLTHLCWVLNKIDETVEKILPKMVTLLTQLLWQIRNCVACFPNNLWPEM